MSRVIKFRVWNFVGECMHDWRELVEKNKIHLLANQQNSYPVMQFTGLTDKNGVEIYEGDIVKSLGVTDYCFGVRPVIFDNGCFKVSGYGLFSGLVEVIGNIYQNPELLK